MAMIVFTAAGRDGAQDEKFAITVGVEQLPWLRAVFHDTLSKLSFKRANEQTVVFKTLGPDGKERIDISLSPEVGVILRLCPERAEEMPWGFSVDTALKLAAILNQIPDKLKVLSANPQRST